MVVHQPGDTLTCALELVQHRLPDCLLYTSADRMTGRPLHLDISDLPMKKGVISNRNKFVLGPSGSGKSF